MPRAKGGAKTRHRRKKILKKAKGYVGGRSRLYRTAAETVLRAGAFAYRDRKAKKRLSRRLWIARINAACREAGLTYSVFSAAMKTEYVSPAWRQAALMRAIHNRRDRRFLALRSR